MNAEVTANQLRAARALLRLDQAELARRAKVSVATIRRLERGDGCERVAPGTVAGIRRSLEQAGAEFIPGGVRHRHRESANPDTLYEDLRTISMRSAARLRGREPLADIDLYDETGLPK